ncbi:MAG: DUF3817 domain-containing protein [Pseudomonadota bacterium]
MAPWPLRHLSLMTLIEGASLIALLLIAVPLKRLADLPIAVSIVGPIHGGLFLWTMGVLALVVLRGQLPMLKGLGVFLAALIPFGGLWSHRMIDRQIAAYGAKPQEDKTQ